MASITYSINGKANNSAIDQTKKGLQSLGTIANQVQTVFKGFMALKAIQVIGKGINDTLSAFETQEKAIKLLTVSIEANSKLTAGSLQRIVGYTSELQKSSIYGDESLQEQATFLSNLGLTEEQIKNLLKAAVDLSSSGIGSLESNVKNLAKQFGGVTGELGETIPALKNFSKEALISGEGIEYIAKQYDGFGKALADETLEGKGQKIANIFGDIKEKIGSVFGAGKFALFDALEEPLANFDAWLDGAVKRVINLIKYIPEILPIIGQIISQMMSNLFNPDYMLTVIVEMVSYLWDMLKTTITNVSPLVWNIFKESINWLIYIHYRISKAIDWVGALLKDILLSAAESFVNLIIKGINKAIGALNKIPGIAINLLDSVDFDSSSRKDVAKSTATSFDEWKKMSGSGALETEKISIGDVLKKQFSDGSKRFGELFEKLGSPLLKGTEDLFKNLFSILDRKEEKVEFKKPSSTTVEEAVINENPNVNVMGGSMSPLTLLGESLAPVIDQFSTMFGAISSVNQIMNWWQTILTSMMTFLEPVLNEVLAPIVGILNILGQMLGAYLTPFIKMLVPIIQLVSYAFVWLYNSAILPLANGIIWIVSTLYNGVANIVNGLIELINKIPGVKIQWRMATLDYSTLQLQKINYADLVKAGTSTTNNSNSSNNQSSSNTGKSASYSGQRDITNNFYFNIDKLSGNDRDEALKMLELIKSSIKLGLANY